MVLRTVIAVCVVSLLSVPALGLDETNGMAFTKSEPGELRFTFRDQGQSGTLAFSVNETANAIGFCKITSSISVKCKSSHPNIQINGQKPDANITVNIQNVCEAGIYRGQFWNQTANCTVADKDVCSGSKGTMPNITVAIGPILVLLLFL